MVPSGLIVKLKLSSGASSVTLSRQPFNLDDYNDLHAFPLKLPPSGYDFEDDETFARLRLQGKSRLLVPPF